MTSAEDYVKNEIARTGFPLELEVQSLLREKGWVTTAQDYYYDEDEKKSRYIDIEATRVSIQLLQPPYPIDPLIMGWNMSIECKKTKRNWVFFPIEDYYLGMGGQFLNFNLVYNSWDISFIFGHYGSTDFASIYTVFPEGKDEIFEAVMQTVKHISYSKRKIWERIQYREGSKYALHFWFPIIVVDGKMWNAFTEKGRITKVVESKHTILKVQYGSGSESNYYALDIVHQSYFSELISLLNRDMKAHELYLSRNKTEIINRLDKEFSTRIKQVYDL